jgi:ADP-heptose:LPS heptosyltransferase
VRDLRGRTAIRQTARLLADASFHVGPEGFLMHLARAVDTRSVIIYGGRILPSEIGYPCNENLSVTPPCSPCWRSNRCDYDRVCLEQITVDMALAAIGRLENRLGQPLETETSLLP